jgi:hypothetical protein
VEREEARVMFMRVSEVTPAAIQHAWAKFEVAAGLQGEPPAIYERIPSTWEELVKQAAFDASRPTIEFYRSRDVIDLLLPVT